MPVWNNNWHQLNGETHWRILCCNFLYFYVSSYSFTTPYHTHFKNWQYCSNYGSLLIVAQRDIQMSVIKIHICLRSLIDCKTNAGLPLIFLTQEVIPRKSKPFSYLFVTNAYKNSFLLTCRNKHTLE